MFRKQIEKMNDGIYIASSVLMGGGLTLAIACDGYIPFVLSSAGIMTGLTGFGLWAGMQVGIYSQKGITLEGLKLLQSIVDGDKEVHAAVTLKKDDKASAVITSNGVSVCIDDFQYKVVDGSVSLEGGIEDNSFDESLMEVFDSALDVVDLFGSIEKEIKRAVSKEIERQLDAEVQPS